MSGPPREPSAWAATLTDQRFTSGALGLPDGQGAIEPVQGVSADALVRTDGEQVYVVGRSTEDTVRAFDPLDPRCPVWETALPELSNAHDLLAHDGRLFVPTFGTGALHVLDPGSGELLETLELGETLDRAVAVDGRILVADQRFQPDVRRDGVLHIVDPAGLTVTDTLPAGPNPRLTPADDGVWVATGWFAFAPATYDADLVDGALAHLDPATGTWTEVTTEAALGGDLHTVVAAGETLVTVAVDGLARSSVACIRDGEVLEGPTDAGWLLTGAAVGPEVLLGVRSSLVVGQASTSDPGILTLDPVTCAATGFTSTTLEPYDLVAL